jgi:pentatricopeptide repeat protein
MSPLRAFVRWHVPGSHVGTDYVMAHRADNALILIEAVRAACLDAAVLAYEDAGIRGLCADGRWEAALAAIRQMDLSQGLKALDGSAPCRPNA